MGDVQNVKRKGASGNLDNGTLTFHISPSVSLIKSALTERRIVFFHISSVTLWCTGHGRRVYLPAFFLTFVSQKAVPPGQEGQAARERSRTSSQGG